MNVVWKVTRRVTVTALAAIVAAALALGFTAASASTARAVATAAKNDPSVLNGIYHIEWSEKELIAAGAGRGYVASEFGFLHGKKGVLTVTLRDGRYQVRERGAPWSPCPGTYAVSGSTLTINFGPSPRCGGRVAGHWSLQKGQLRLRVTRATDLGSKVTQGGKPWKKIA